MEYKDIGRNILWLVQNLGYLKKEQIEQFFADVGPQSVTDYNLNLLMNEHKLIYDYKTDIYSFHANPDLIDEYRERLIHSFWILAHFHSRNVTGICVMSYPQLFMFTTAQQDIYDVTMCMNEADAMLAARKIDLACVRGIADEINHIVVVYDIEMGRSFGKYGFDVLCYIDPQTHYPYYEDLRG